MTEGQTGLLVPPEDPPALAAALVSLCADPELAARLGLAGARQAEARFGLATMVDRYRALLESLAAGRRA